MERQPQDLDVPDPGLALLSAASDLTEVASRHAADLRTLGLDDVVERLEELVLVLAAGAQEIAAAMQELPGGRAPESASTAAAR